MYNSNSERSSILSEKRNEIIRKNIKFLLNYTKGLGWYFFGFLFFGLMSISFSVVLPFIFRMLLDKVILAENLTNENLNILIEITFISISLIITRLIGFFLNTYFARTIGIKVAIRLRRDALVKAQKLKYEYYDENSPGKVSSSIMDDASELYGFSTKVPENLFLFIIQTTAAIVTVAIVSNWIIVITILLNIIILTTISYFLNKRIHKTSSEAIRKDTELCDLIAMTFDGIREIKSYSNEKIFSDKFKFATDNYKQIYGRLDRGNSFVGGVIGVLSFILPQMLLAVALYLLFLNKTGSAYSINKGSYIAVVFCMFLITEPINKLANFFVILPRGYQSIKRFNDFFSLPDEENSGEVLIGNKIERIDFIDVDFRYPKKNSSYVLKNFNLSIKNNEKIAIVGETGIGKSTILKLLIRGYDVENGQILINGLDIKKYDVKSLRSGISYIQQSGVMFDDSIKNNIAFGNLKASDEEIIEASKKANIYDEILDMPGKFDFNVGVESSKISGGQKQRLSLARSFLKKTNLILLDEATSALDNNTERMVIKAIDKFINSNDCLSIIVAHRINTIRNVDKIIYLGRNGKVIEQGNYESLIKNKGEFFNFANKSIIED